MSTKLSSAYKTIGEVVKILDTTEPIEIKINTHTLRFWEKQFKIVRPKIFNSRRYYNIETIKILKKIKFLLKEKGMTIEGAKNQINSEKTLVDENNISNINNSEKIKFKLKKISKLIKELKKN